MINNFSISSQNYACFYCTPFSLLSFSSWTPSQVAARSHPNILAVSTWLNGLYHAKPDTQLDGVDLKSPLTYADRFRIRHPSLEPWGRHPPHVDGGGIERWEDANFRKCFADILSGNWSKHDPYDLQGRLNARTSMYGRPNQASLELLVETTLLELMDSFSSRLVSSGLSKDGSL